MRIVWLTFVVCLGCSESSTNDTQNASGGGGGSGGSVTGGTGGALGGSAGSSGSGGIAGAAAGAGDGGAGTGGDPCRNDDLKINEVSTMGSGSGDEFIELYNPLPRTASLDGFSLETAGPTGPGQTVWAGNTGDEIAGNSYFVIGGVGFTGNTDADISTGSIPDVGGVGLFQSMNLIDGVAYGNGLTAHEFLEGAPANNDGVPGSSMARSVDGQDCDNNSVDFVLTERTPGATNSP